MTTLQGKRNLGFIGSSSDGLNDIAGSNVIIECDGKAGDSNKRHDVLNTNNVSIIKRGIDKALGFRKDTTCSLKSLTWVGDDFPSRDQPCQPPIEDHVERFHASLGNVNIIPSGFSSLTVMAHSKTLYSGQEALPSVAIDNYGTISTVLNEPGHPIPVNCVKNRWVLCVSTYMLTYPLICLTIWALLYIFWGEMAFPGGSLFALIILEVTAICLGNFVGLLGPPPLLGMIIAGLILRNVPYINVAKDLHLSISSPLRGISVVILLTRGGFSVNPLNIKKFKNVVPSLAIGSCIIEALCGGVAAYFILGFPPAWAALMGCIFSAMSGAAVMPYLIEIEKFVTEDTSNMNGNAKKAVTIAKTACGLDAILAICMAEFALGFVFGDANVNAGFAKGPGEVVLGGAFGMLWGSATGLLLGDHFSSDLRVLAVFSGGVMSLIGLNKIGYPRGGPLGVFLGSLVAMSIWRHRQLNGLDKVNESFDKLWFLFQPLLFGILGARTEFFSVDWTVVKQGVICLAICILGRLIASYLMTSWSHLHFRERMFLVISWMPKGTVQAALGPVALDTAYDLGLEGSYETLGNKVMNVAAATVIISSILGSMTLKFVGPRLLKKT